MSDAPEIPRLGAIREALAARGRRPTRRFSQNFLTDPALLGSIVDAAGVEAGDVVLEVGPGPGALTAALLARGATVVAVEVDRVMAEVLRELLGEPERLVLVEEDARAGGGAPSPSTAAALDRAEASAARSGYRLAANLPYAIASPLLVDLLWTRPPVAGAVTVQFEVADRLVAAPGSRAYGALSVLVALRAEATKVRRLPAGAFWPAPKVDSA
ncbi:MAG: ribosomal RNA small subunit methyltransferase A, partial [Planctomycetota bacterium JB042]